MRYFFNDEFLKGKTQEKISELLVVNVKTVNRAYKNGIKPNSKLARKCADLGIELIEFKNN